MNGESSAPSIDQTWISRIFNYGYRFPLEEAKGILFHHGVGIDMDIWIDWLPHLSKNFRCVRFDMRGCGKSSIPPDGQEWSMEEMMSDVLAVANAVNADKFHLIGESIGGTISLYTALNASNRITTVTALSTGHRGNHINWML